MHFTRSEKLINVPLNSVLSTESLARERPQGRWYMIRLPLFLFGSFASALLSLLSPPFVIGSRSEERRVKHTLYMRASLAAVTGLKDSKESRFVCVPGPILVISKINTALSYAVHPLQGEL